MSSGKTNEDIHVIDIDGGKETKKPVPPVLDQAAKESNTCANENAAPKPPKPSIEQAVQKARNTFNSGITRPVKWRRQQLRNLYRMYEENINVMIDALHQDLGRSKTESMSLEINFVMNDLKYILNNIDSWTKPEKPPREFVYWLDQLLIFHDPYGVVLIIGAWNYPLVLSLAPMAGAIAAGNTVILKPSEVSPASSNFMRDYVTKYLDNNAFIVIEGGPDETKTLLSLKFDYIFYTGSTNIGKIIYESAAKNLTPVTLELGGKSPVYVDETADIEKSVERILWGKFINAGQTCIAPDYVLCTKETQQKFVTISRKILNSWLGNDPQNSRDYSRIVNNRHYNRLQELLDGCRHKIAVGGKHDAGDNFMDLTILANVDPNDKVMESEIFGPILPICPIKDVDEALKFINERDKPLVLYVFSRSSKVQKTFARYTSSGSICFNDTVYFTAAHHLPFGGVGASGIGTYHGKMTFDTFTHRKSCLKRNFFIVGHILTSVRNPPYNTWKLLFGTEVLRERYTPPLKYLPHIIAFMIGSGMTYYMLNVSKVDSELIDATNITMGF